ncbi:PqqD family peptide modification chaperone [Methyloferula stellata]|uniref:PqqD family peptide modification chaperone n=1 Tax=Methyloferula stellata TaxID=876270 RepID=UPI0003769F13|nr:PqqD family peptide modification chaperone [Methyloferula stellata]
MRSHAELHRHTFRGDVWYVLQDHHTGRFHRVSPTVNLMLCLMNGQRTVQEIWDAVAAKATDQPPTQDETIQLLSQLHASDLLQSEFSPDLNELSERSERHNRRELIQRLRSPLSFRLPLFDPDRLVGFMMPLVRPIFSAFGFFVWCVLVAAAAVLVILHWSELTQNVTDRALAAENIVVILLIYPVIKTLHELGHAFATKRWGGEVHEIGVMLLVFVPVAYVDASSSAAFIEKRRRIIVGAAGIMVELGLAAIAAFVWVNASPGLLRTVAFNTMLIGGVSTLIFNGNPLLRFDGYYILSDLIEIPNLADRSNKYVFYLLQHYVFGLDQVDSPATGRGEEPWLFLYSISSFLYRTTVSIGIALFLASRFFFFGIAMALWALTTIFVMPCVKGAKYLLYDRRLDGYRRRTFSAVGGTAAIVIFVLFLLPLPYATVAEGVLWMPNRSEVRARTSGFIDAVLPSEDVSPGNVLVKMNDPIIASQVDVRNAQLDELQERYNAARLIDRVQAEILTEQINHIQKAIAVLAGRNADLRVSSSESGHFVALHADDLPGRFVKQGELLGYVIGKKDVTVRTIVTQGDVDLVRQRTKRVLVRFANDLSTVHAAEIVREIPSAEQEVPSMALTTQGGGTIAVDPNSKSPKPQALFGLFQFDIALDSSVPVDYAGERAFVLFDFGKEPIAWRFVRAFRQAFLSHFHV